MDDWVGWIVAAGVLAVGEIVTTSFFLGPIALAALPAALVALLGAGVALQVAVFVVAAIASLGLIRPVARRHLQMPARIRTGAAALPGQSAIVLDRVDRDGGQVKLGGEIWSARSFVEEEVHEPGKRVHVIKIEGATALVDD